MFLQDFDQLASIWPHWPAQQGLKHAVYDDAVKLERVLRRLINDNWPEELLETAVKNIFFINNYSTGVHGSA